MCIDELEDWRKSHLGNRAEEAMTERPDRMEEKAREWCIKHGIHEFPHQVKSMADFARSLADEWEKSGHLGHLDYCGKSGSCLCSYPLAAKGGE